MRLKQLIILALFGGGLYFLSPAPVLADCGGCQVTQDCEPNPSCPDDCPPICVYVDGCNGCTTTSCGPGTYECNTGCCGCEISGCPEDEGGGCFPAGTEVTLETGEKKNIETVAVGDRVRGRGGSVNTVQALIQPVSDHFCRIDFENGESLEVTNSHPLFTDSGWKAINIEAARREQESVPVSELEAGDRIFNVSGENPSVKNITCWEETVQTYNFTVDNTNTFYAGGFLAHNKGSACYAPQRVNCPANSTCIPSAGMFCNPYNVNYNSATEYLPTEKAANNVCVLGNAQAGETYCNAWFCGTRVVTYACCPSGTVSQYYYVQGADYQVTANMCEGGQPYNCYPGSFVSTTVISQCGISVKDEEGQRHPIYVYRTTCRPEPTKVYVCSSICSVTAPNFQNQAYDAVSNSISWTPGSNANSHQLIVSKTEAGGGEDWRDG